MIGTSHGRSYAITNFADSPKPVQPNVIALVQEASIP